MNLRRIISIGCLCAATLAMHAQAFTQSPANGQVWKCVLLEGSYLIDDCPACGRPTILQPMRGSFDLLALDQALDRLADREEHLAKVVELRFFCGLEILETAQILGISESTVRRDWIMARAWLRRELTR